MAAASTLSSVAYIYKINYATEVGEVAQRMHPQLKMIEKRGGFTGSPTFNYPIRYGNGQGVSGTFAAAQASATGTKGLQFAASRFKKYGIITLDGEALQACDSKGSFLDLVTNETDAIIDELTDRLAFDLYRDGTGKRGQRASASVNVITLVNPDTARNFKLGQTLVADNAANGLSPGAGTTTVTSVDSDLGTVTLLSAAGLSGFADLDYLFGYGDPGTCMEGLEACTPLAAPVLGSDSFRTVDRGVYPSLLAGSRVNDTSTNIEENAGLVAVKISGNGGKSNTCMLNPINFYKVTRRLNAKVEYDDAGGEAKWGFEHVSISTSAGILKCYADPDCPIDRGRVYDSGSHYIKTLEDFTHIIMDDGRPNLRSTDADSVEARARSMANYIQPDTRNHGVFAI